jgi:hypothetical protein
MTLFTVAAVLAMLGQSGNMEDAAFLVRDAHGTVQVVRWPSAGLPDSAIWIGRVPEGAFAIAHTHPDWRPRPSKTDIVTARTAKMPVYVVTRSQVWETAAGVAFRVR